MNDAMDPRIELRFLDRLDPNIFCVVCRGTRAPVVYARPAWWAAASITERAAVLRAARGDPAPPGVFTWGWAPAGGRPPQWVTVPDEAWEALAQREAP